MCLLLPRFAPPVIFLTSSDIHSFSFLSLNLPWFFVLHAQLTSMPAAGFSLWGSFAPVISAAAHLFLVTSQSRGMFPILHQKPMFQRMKEPRHLQNKPFSGHWFSVLCWSTPLCVTDRRTAHSLWTHSLCSVVSKLQTLCQSCLPPLPKCFQVCQGLEQFC